MMKKSSYEESRQIGKSAIHALLYGASPQTIARILQETIPMPAKKAKKTARKLTKAHREAISRGKRKKIGAVASVLDYLQTENDSALKRSSRVPSLKTGQTSQPLVAGIDTPKASFPTAVYNQTATLPVEQLVEEHIRWVKEYIARHRAAVLNRINY
jgi:hypothetical protein